MDRPIQELADARLDPLYRQPVKTLEVAMAAIGWPFVDRPVCCGEPVDVRAFIGSAYAADCKHCGRFIFDVTGPEFTNSAVAIPEGYEDGDARWVSGIRDKSMDDVARIAIEGIPAADALFHDPSTERAMERL